MAIGLITSPSTWLLGTIVSPSWLQNVQDNINGMIAGTGPTLKALQIDGTGGATSTQASGTLGVSSYASVGGENHNGGDMLTVNGGNLTVYGQILANSNTVSGTTFVPTSSAVGNSVPTPTLNQYNLYKELIPVAWGVYTGTGGFFIQGVNVASATRNSAGSYTFTLKNQTFTGASNSVAVLATCSGTLFAAANANTTSGTTTVNVLTSNTSGTATDCNAVTFLVFGA